MRQFHGHRKRHIGVPRGMLRPITMILLKETPMSGSEIAEKIEYYAEWKPSPGSIYPMLSNLEEEGLIKPTDDSDPNLKRFTLTEKGENELEIHKNHDKEIRKRSKTMRKIYWKLFRGMTDEVYESFIGLVDRIEESYESIDDLSKFKALLDTTLKEIEKMEREKIE